MVAVAAAIGIGATSAGYPEWALVLAVAIFALGLAISAPLVAIAFSVVATLLMQRIGGAFSVSDAVLALAMALALFQMRGHAIRSMSTLLWAGAGYLAAIVPTLILNPYPANGVDWSRDIVLVLGSLLVGFVIGARGRARLAVGMYVIGCCGIAVAAVIAGAVMAVQQHRFGPVYLPYLDKNLIGVALAGAVIVVYGRSAWFRLPSRLRWFVIILCSAGVAASGARQAMVGLAIGLVVVALRRDPVTGKRPKLPWLIVAVVPYVVWTTVVEQLNSGNAYNSASQRLNWFQDSLQIWQSSPLFGVGLRWWYTDRFTPQFQPPNLVFEQLTTVGVVGLVALVALFAVGFVTLWRLDPAYGTVGAAIVASRFVGAQFDLFWVAGQASFLWIIAGICFGACARAGSASAGAPLPASLERSATVPGRRGVRVGPGVG